MSDVGYIHLWTWGLLIIVFITSMIGVKDIKKNGNLIGTIIMLLVIAYIGFRPISHLFGDTTAYARKYSFVSDYANETYESDKDFGFQVLTNMLIPFHSVTIYFLVIACIYVLPVVAILKKKLGPIWLYAFLLVVCSFSFWGYGVNGLRNGLSTSVLLFSFFTERKYVKFLLFFVAVSFHQSALLPILMYLLAHRFSNSRIYIWAWLISIPLTIVGHTAIEGFISLIDLGGDMNRLSDYMSSTVSPDDERFSSYGFRWDFLLYSSVPIILGYYYIYMKKCIDKLYIVLYNVYIGCNTFWIFCIYVPYCNRFAYLSWFLYPIIISWPVLSHNVVGKRQAIWIKSMLLLNYAFTFIMFVK